MKSEEFKNMIRQIIQEELQSVLKEQKEQWWLKPAEAVSAPAENPHLVHEEMCEGEGCLDEKSVPQPYNRKGARKMTKSQVEKRRKIGKEMMRNEKTADKFRKKYGDDWKDYLWAAATSAAFRSK